jgi:flagellar biosynthetic protein FliP
MVTDVSVTAEKRGALRGRAAAASTARVILRSNAPAMQVARFAGHYVQMSIAMYVGMLLPLGLLLSALGLGLYLRTPEGSALLMTGEMVIGMAAWMAIRRHPWRHTVEMSAGMAASTVLAAVASLAGLLPHTAVDSTLVGLLMWVGMLAAMLFRWRDYAQYGHCHGGHEKAAA